MNELLVVLGVSDLLLLFKALLDLLQKSPQLVVLLSLQLPHQVLNLSVFGMGPLLKLGLFQTLDLFLHLMGLDVFFLFSEGFLDLAEVDNLS